MAFIYSPGLDQSVALAGFIRDARPDEEIVGVLLPGERKPWRGTAFNRFATCEDVPPGEVIVPTGARSTQIVLERGDARCGSVRLAANALRWFDKPWALAMAVDAGVPVPQTWVLAGDVLQFPVFYKSAREGVGRRGLACRRSELPVDDHLIYQEYVNSRGTYGVTFIAEEGELLAAHVHFEGESFPEIGGSAVVIEQFEDPILLDYTQRLLRSSKYTGWGLAEFKFNPRTEDYVFMEINAKFWASIEFSFRNEPRFAQLLLGIDRCGTPVERMVFLHRAVSRGLSYAARLLQKLPPSTERRFVNGLWQEALVRAMLPRPTWLRSLLRRFG